MSKSRDIADSAATINFIDTVTSNVQDQLGTLTTALDNISVTSGTLTKTFATNESASISLTSSVLAPVVSVTKEVPQTGVTNNNWDVSSTTENYTRLDSAAATTLSFTGGASPFVLGTGSFAAADVGKTIEANSGAFVLTATDGSYVETTAPTSYAQVASGDWSMYGIVYNAADGDLELSRYDDIYNIADASYDSVSFSVSSQEANATGMTFSADGTSMYVIGRDVDDINQYTLSTAFDITTASYTRVFSVASQESDPTDVKFNSDGTKMFVLGYNGDEVNEYALSTAWNISTATFTSNFSVASQEIAPRALAFNNDGTRMYIAGAAGSDIVQYTLTTGFDVTTAAFLSVTLDVSAHGQPNGLAFNNTGKELFVLGYSDFVYLYSLSTAFDVSTATYTGTSFSLAAQSTSPESISFNSSGSKMFMLNNNTVFQYSTGGGSIAPSGYQPVHTTASIDSTYWTDINSMTADQAAGDGNVYYAISTDDRTTWTVIDNTDGERDIVKNNAGTWQYNSNATYASQTWVNGATNTELATLAEAMEGAAGGTSYDIANASYDSVSFSVGAQEGAPSDFSFNTDGTKMFVIGTGGQDVNEYTLSTAYDVSTSSFVDSFSVASQESSPYALAFNNDGSKMYVTGAANDTVYQYTLSTGFDVSTASYSSISFSYSAQEGVARSLSFNPTGTKMYIYGAVSSAIFEYSLSTGFDVSTASYIQSFSVSSAWGHSFNNDGSKLFFSVGTAIKQYSLSTNYDISTLSDDAISFSISAQAIDSGGLVFANAGVKMYVLGRAADTVYQYSVGTTTYTNQMDKTQLDAVTDPNHIALGDDLDLAIVFNMTSGSTVPSSDGVAINYDANVLNKGAVLGTDYDFDAPTQNSVRITALAGNNLKVRVV